MDYITVEVEYNNITGLAKNDLGYQLSKHQILPFLEETKDSGQILRVLFSDNVESISISFVQGFMKGLSGLISKPEFDRYIKIDGSKSAVLDFYNGMEFRC